MAKQFSMTKIALAALLSIFSLTIICFILFVRSGNRVQTANPPETRSPLAAQSDPGLLANAKGVLNKGIGADGDSLKEEQLLIPEKPLLLDIDPNDIQEYNREKANAIMERLHKVVLSPENASVKLDPAQSAAFIRDFQDKSFIRGIKRNGSSLYVEFEQKITDLSQNEKVALGKALLAWSVQEYKKPPTSIFAQLTDWPTGDTRAFYVFTYSDYDGLWDYYPPIDSLKSHDLLKEFQSIGILRRVYRCKANQDFVMAEVPESLNQDHAVTVARTVLAYARHQYGEENHPARVVFSTNDRVLEFYSETERRILTRNSRVTRHWFTR